MLPLLLAAMVQIEIVYHSILCIKKTKSLVAYFTHKRHSMSLIVKKYQIKTKCWIVYETVDLIFRSIKVMTVQEGLMSFFQNKGNKRNVQIVWHTYSQTG